MSGIDVGIDQVGVYLPRYVLPLNRLAEVDLLHRYPARLRQAIERQRVPRQIHAELVDAHVEPVHSPSSSRARHWPRAISGK